MNDSIEVDRCIARVKDGFLTTQQAITFLTDQGIFVGRGTKSRLLRAEADFILRSDHRYFASSSS